MTFYYQGPEDYVTHVTDDVREKEMERNLSDIEESIANLKAIALDMGNELKTQNHMVDRLNTKPSRIRTAAAEQQNSL